MSETRVAFPERLKRPLKNILSRYMEGCGYKYIQNLQHFNAKMNSGITVAKT